jgi:hypothetical protein
MGGGISHKRDVLICDGALFNHLVVDLKTANDANSRQYRSGPSGLSGYRHEVIVICPQLL